MDHAAAGEQSRREAFDCYAVRSWPSWHSARTLTTTKHDAQRLVQDTLMRVQADRALRRPLLGRGC
jgi:hypothetical protein